MSLLPDFEFHYDDESRTVTGVMSHLLSDVRSSSLQNTQRWDNRHDLVNRIGDDARRQLSAAASGEGSALTSHHTVIVSDLLVAEEIVTQRAVVASAEFPTSRCFFLSKDNTTTPKPQEDTQAIRLSRGSVVSVYLPSLFNLSIINIEADECPATYQGD